VIRSNLNLRKLAILKNALMKLILSRFAMNTFKSEVLGVIVIQLDIFAIWMYAMNVCFTNDQFQRTTNAIQNSK